MTSGASADEPPIPAAPADGSRGWRGRRPTTAGLFALLLVVVECISASCAIRPTQELLALARSGSRKERILAIHRLVSRGERQEEVAALVKEIHSSLDVETVAFFNELESRRLDEFRRNVGRRPPPAR